MRIAVGFSGGRDSTAAALLLKRDGHEVEAVTLRLGVPGEDGRLAACARLAAQIGVSHRVVEARETFRRVVIQSFLDGYSAGLTPNPCVTCNGRIKFDILMDAALARGAERFATGHYARLEREGEGLLLAEPREKRKSQIYFLAMVNPRRMQRVCFPLGTVTLRQVKALTGDLALAGEKSSQDVCFLGGISLSGYLRDRIPEAFRPGPILDVRGREIGRHRGLAAVTIGQRRGLAFAGGRRLYVVRKDLERNAVILGEQKDLESREISLGRPVFWRPLEAGEKLDLRVRYAGPAPSATVIAADAAGIHARFNGPVRAVTPGQLGVCYSRGRVVAAGIIEEKLKS